MDTIHHAVEDKDSHPLLKKGKKKKRAPKDGMNRQLAKGEGEDVKDNGTSSVHSQMNEQKNIEETPEQYEPNHSEIREVEIKKKKRKRHSQDDTNPQITKQAWEGQETQQGAHISPDSAVDNESRPRKKKRNKKKSSTIPKVKSLLEDTIDEKPKKQKKHKNRTGFPNPEENTDEIALQDQAKKALSYAFKQFHKPDLWKFNKAKQNWLVRNLWKAKAIPGKYDGLIIRYLSAVQGKARENLVKTCQEVIKAQPPLNEERSFQQTGVAPSGPVIDATYLPEVDERKARAQALLQALTSQSNT